MISSAVLLVLDGAGEIRVELGADGIRREWLELDVPVSSCGYVDLTLEGGVHKPGTKAPGACEFVEGSAVVVGFMGSSASC